ncbi:MAG: hypothetical protein M3Y80_04370, partial [Verrucomicrobiota bacterium]|nr:hypothetical protein [Verrucomicrobiota bacterium]
RDLYQNIRSMKRISIAAVITAFVSLVLLVNVSLSAPAEAGTPITLRNGAAALVVNGSLSLRSQTGKYTPALAGRYETRDGKQLVVGAAGHLDAKSVALMNADQSKPAARDAKALPAPKGAKAPSNRAASESGGGRVKVGSHF